jgi:hypothetical protein
MLELLLALVLALGPGAPKTSKAPTAADQTAGGPGGPGPVGPQCPESNPNCQPGPQ